jgi:hypothetical protein
MVEDTRRFKSTDEMMNAVFGSIPLSDEQRRQREADHARAQVRPPPAPEPPKRPGWTPKGYVSSATDALAFRNNMAPPTEADLERLNRNTMAEIVRDIRKGR